MRTVLVADDDRAHRNLLRRALELSGYAVRLAEDGEACLREVERDPRTCWFST
ncbi:hypothetical protein [Calidithermus chliarophilus]|uniref:hypothetical protein n=1 Tax=Calidithermus chliarophilus TaxID=52023 RepID=UPI00146F9C88|nr:hypothetical protein [Calidithermus chliarophilus]